MKKIGFILLCILIHSNSKAADLSQLVGRYAHYDIVSYVGDLIGPLKLKNRIISFGIAELFMNNDKLMMKNRFCFSDYKANLPFQAKTSDEFTRAIIPKVVEMEVMQTNEELLLFRPETPTLLGVDLEYYTDNFPKHSDDPRFIDADQDGKPGVSVNIKMGRFIDEKIYIARKEIFSYDLKRRDNGILAGIVRDRSQQFIIGGTKPSLVTKNNPVQNRDLSKSPIYLIPMKQNLNCDELKQRRDLYFPKRDKSHKKFYKNLDLTQL